MATLKIDLDSVIPEGVTSIPEVRKEIGTSVSALDMWFPHVSKNMLMFWGYEEFYKYCETLLIDNRDKPRRGFPLEVMEEIALISKAHDGAFPEIAKKCSPAYDNTRIP